MFGEVNESVKAYGDRRPSPRRRDRAGARAALGGGRREPGRRGVDFLPHLIPMTRGILSACHVRPTRPIEPGRARRPVRGGVRRRAVRDGRRRAAGDEARPRQQPRPGLRPPRRADRPDPRDRRDRQPREGRRRPGDPGVQPRPRPARDGRPRAAARSPRSTPTTRWRPPPPPSPRCRPTSRRSSGAPRSRRASSPPAAWPGSRRPAGRTSRSSRPSRAPTATASPRPRPRSSRRTRSRPRRSACRRPISRRPSPPATAGSAGRPAIISTSGCANAATGAAGDADQAAVADDARRTPSGRRRAQTLLLSTGIIGTRLPLDDRAGGHRRAWRRRWPPTDDGLAAAAEALRTTDSLSRSATTTITLPDPDGLAVRSVRVTGIAKGVGMIHPADGDDAVDRPDRRDRRSRRRSTGCSGRPPPGRGTSSASTATRDERHGLRPRVRRGRRRAVAAGHARGAPTLGRAIEAVARDLARQQAADGEGATTLITCQVSGAIDDADARAVARAVVSSVARQGGGPRPRPELGPDRRRRGQRDASPTRRSWRPPGSRRGRAERGPGRAADARSGPAPDRDRRPSRVRRRRPADRSPSTATRRGRRWTRPELLIRLDLGLGDGTGEAFGCDLTETYVHENCEYTT